MIPRRNYSRDRCSALKNLNVDLTKHCQLCDNQVVSLMGGTTCGLTKQKPDFNKTCIKIQLNDKFEQKVKEINVDHEKVRRTKKLTYTYFIVFLIISLAVMIGGYLLGSYILEKGVISTVPLIIIGVGFTILPIAFGPVNNYRNEMSIIKKKKENLDGILSLYNIDYSIDMKFGKEIHGTQEVETDLKIHRKRH